MGVQSVSVAKVTLKNLLISVRMQCSPEVADRLAGDLYHTVSKYMEIKRENFDITVTRTDIHIKYMGEKN